MSQQTFVLLDGHSIVFRAFHALPLLTTRAGQPTNAVYGFTRMLLRVLKDLEPDYLAVAFDTPTPTFRHERFEAYKANRAAAPEELRSQFPLVDELLDSMQIRQLRLDGFEADDLMGALAKRFGGEEVRVLLVSGDLDVLQVVDENVNVLITLRGASELKRYDVAAFRERFGFDPRQLPDYKALCGDSSDNIPGLRGIGDKTASALIAEFGSVENLLEHVEEVKPKRAREALTADSETALLGKLLTTIRLDVPLDVALEDCRLRLPDDTALRDLFAKYEFTSLVKELGGEVSSAVAVEVLRDDDALAAAAGRAAAAGTVALCFDYPNDAQHYPRGLGFSFEAGTAFYVPVPAPVGDEPEEGALPGLAEVRALPPAVGELLACDTPKLTHDARRAHWSADLLGLTLDNVAGDVMLASWLLNPERQGHPVPDIARDHLQRELPTLPTGRLKKGEQQPTPERIAEVCAAATEAVLALHPLLEAELCERDELELYRDVELPLAPVLWRMEQTGMRMEGAHLEEMAASLDARIAALASEIHELAGEPFNIGSPKQLQQILFEKLGLPAGKRTKTGYSTSADVLEKLADQHDVVRKILEYREHTKLKSTYVEGLRNAVNPETGRIHTTFNQTGTATGRLSSSDPNLQNIPIRTEAGREIRRAFVAPEGCWLLCADYSQVELRVLAHITEDPGLVAAFANDEDIHTRTAAQLFAVDADEVTSDMRRQAKVVNFGIAYGMSPMGLARDLEIGLEEAQQYILNYFATYPGVQDYMRETVERARVDGYVTTLRNRRRYLPDLNSPNARAREFAERTAINAPIQGTAADLMKVAMLDVEQALQTEGLPAKMTLQVHDELVFECPRAALDAVAARVVQLMCDAMPLRVPLLVEAEYGPNWRDLTPWRGEAQS